MERLKVIDNLRFMMNELSRMNAENPSHEIVVKIRTLRAAIEELEKQSWIPVTDRLSEEGQEVLVTRTGVGGDYVTTDEYDWDYCAWASDADDITAWMPFPEPYKR